MTFGKILAAIGGVTAVLTALSFLVKKWIETRIQKSVEYEYNVKLEQTKTELSKEAYKHSVIFDHTEKATVAAFQNLTVYRLQLEHFIDSCVIARDSFVKENSERGLVSVREQFQAHLNEHQIYITKHPLEKLRAVEIQFANIRLSAHQHFASRIGAHPENVPRSMLPGDTPELLRQASGLKALKGSIEKSMAELHDLIQRDLGISPRAGID